MGRVIEKNKYIDVICQHKVDGSMIPLRIRICDEDGVYQIYHIHSYKVLTQDRNGFLPNELGIKSRICAFECEIIILGRKQKVRLFYNAYDQRWRMTWF